MIEDRQLLTYNLSLFAKDGPGGEKTEDATPKKADDARKEGQVAKSRDLAGGISLLALFLCMKYAIGFVGEKFLEIFPLYYKTISRYVTEGMNSTSASGLINDVIIKSVIIMAPFFAVGVAVAFFSEKIQIRWKVTTKPMQPKFSKMNPINGFKKLFSKETIMEFVKSLMKMGVIAYLAYSTIINYKDSLYSFYEISLNQSLALMFDIVINLGIKISIAMIVIGIIDFIFQKWKFRQDIKMSKQEVKDEYKNSEGDPTVKGQQKQRMRQAAQRRMMQSVPEADVVITNPTHFAVALKYEQNSGQAPIVIAKGSDFLAGKIKEIARDNNVEIVENKSLARMLYYNVDIGNEIPGELYQAVAEVLAYVYRIKNKI